MTELKEFRLPDVGEGLTEADIVAWHVKPGDQVEVNQIIVEIETAKAVVELPSPWDGTVARLLAEEGQTVDVGTPIIAVEVAARTRRNRENDSAERSVVPAPATASRSPWPARSAQPASPAIKPARDGRRRSWSATASRPRPPRAGRARRRQPADRQRHAASGRTSTRTRTRRGPGPGQAAGAQAGQGSRHQPGRSWRAPGRTARSPGTTCTGRPVAPRSVRNKRS